MGEEEGRFEPNREEFSTDVEVAHGVDDTGPFVELNLNGLPYRSTPKQADATGKAMVRTAQMSRMFHTHISLLRKKGWPDEAISEYMNEIHAHYEELYGVMGVDDD